MDINIDKELDLIDDLSRLVGQAMTKIQMCDEAEQSSYFYRRYEDLENLLGNLGCRKREIETDRQAMNAMAL